MGGGLLQLKAYGNENIYLNGNPQITFFKMAYKRYTNFAMQSIQVLNKGMDTLSYTIPTRVRFPIPRNADLFDRIFLSIQLPDIFCNVHQQFRWIPRLGTNMIESVRMFIGTTMVEQLDGEYIDIFYELNGTDEQYQQYSQLSAHDATFHHPQTDTGNGYPFSTNDPLYSSADPLQNLATPTILMGNPGYLNKPTIPGKRIYIPLPFWFTRHIGQAVPLIALQNHEVYMEVNFRPIRDLYQVGSMEEIPLHESVYKADAPNIPYYRVSNANSIKRVVWRRPEGPTDELRHFTGLTDNTWPILPYLEVNYIFLDDHERRMFATNSHQYVIERVNRVTEEGILSSKTITVEIYHPVKEIIAVFRRDDFKTRNQWSNYTNLEDETSRPSEYYHYYWNLLQQVRTYHANDLAQVLSPEIYAQFMANPLYLFGMFRTDKLRTVDPLVYDPEMLRTYLLDPNANPSPIPPMNTELVTQLATRYGKTVTLGEFREAMIRPVLNLPDPNPTGAECNCNPVRPLVLLSRHMTWNNDDILRMVNQWEYRLAKDIPAITRENYTYYEPHILEEMEIRFDGETRLEKKPHTYFGRIQPFVHHSRQPRHGIYSYSFAVEPEKAQPSGACNFSQLNTLEFVLKLKDPTSYEVGRYASVKYNADFFILSYNVLQIMGGMAGLMYGN